MKRRKLSVGGWLGFNELRGENAETLLGTGIVDIFGRTIDGIIKYMG